jgi:hypothetical protein
MVSSHPGARAWLRTTRYRGQLDSRPPNQLMSASTHSGDILVVGVPADIAQLVERNLAKVEVAGSSPVVRSKASCLRRRRNVPSAKG